MEVAKASGKLGILVPGMGAVGTTFIAGVYAINKGKWVESESVKETTITHLLSKR